ncbi:MAG: hypothetical protein LW875_03955 [Proteobacteria bacterium]|nr:hypothetical protein [Pseudomonadota bacterium]
MTASKLLVPSLMFLLSGCASQSQKDTFVRDMALGALVGVAVASGKSNNREAYALMYGGLGAAAAGVVSGATRIKELEKTQKSAQYFEKKAQELEAQQKPKLFDQGQGLFATPLPKEVTSLVEPGEWKRYKLDQWVQDPTQPNTWYRQVEMFEITPPTAK